ncbi:MAG: hypothetical protein GY849_02220 [Deltaproteobacteria bacterium]|nr:hypothetical protein [Deltaproteobacteria bacterium]
MKNIVLSYVLKFEHATELHVKQFNTKKEANVFLDNHKIKKWILLWEITEIKQSEINIPIICLNCGSVNITDKKLNKVCNDCDYSWT